MWLGYNNTLGCKNIDYIISDKNLIKENEISSYVEKILFMPNIWNALSPPDKLPNIEKNLNNSKFIIKSAENVLSGCKKVY